MNQDARPRVILIDTSDATREVLATRLRAQGYQVEAADDAATGAELALSAPPNVVVADLWMPSISGIQICRLLRSEPATADVPVILRGDKDDPKSRFWAERAGATAYVMKGRMGDLVRALVKATSLPREEDVFFIQLGGGSLGIRDRIAQHLDAALFESVVAAEVRALASAGSFERLFDLLSQLLSQLCSYRWLAVATNLPTHFAIHTHPKIRPIAVEEARDTLLLRDTIEPMLIEDEDAVEAVEPTEAVALPIAFAGAAVGAIALAPNKADTDAATLVPILARELGGPLRMTALVEESQRQASVDPLTGLMNRRAFAAAMDVELARASRHGYPLSLLLLDVDHFKAINDRFGHAGGDQVLAAIGALLHKTMRKTDLESRWGGEEFVLALTSTDLAGARVTAERVRRDIEALSIETGDGQAIAVTASIGVAVLRAGEAMVKLVDRADQAMYAAKVGGRNRVVIDTSNDPALTPPTYDGAPEDPAAGTPAGENPAEESATGGPTSRRRAVEGKAVSN